MKFVRNGWREKSFFRQVRADRIGFIRQLGKPMAPMGYSFIYMGRASSYHQLRQQKNALIRRGMALLATHSQTRTALVCRIGTNECYGLFFSYFVKALIRTTWFDRVSVELGI